MADPGALDLLTLQQSLRRIAHATEVHSRRIDRELGLTHVAYVLLWYPLFTQPFIFREVEGLKGLLPLSVYSLYGPNLRHCSNEMRAVAGEIFNLYFSTKTPEETG